VGWQVISLFFEVSFNVPFKQLGLHSVLRGAEFLLSPVYSLGLLLGILRGSFIRDGEIQLLLCFSPHVVAISPPLLSPLTGVVFAPFF